MTSVLVVDDDQDLAEMLGIVLNGAGIEVDLVSNGDEAVDVFRNNQPDLVLLDIMLPGLDGITVCREIRKESTRVPIVMLTAKGDTHDIVKGLEAGADDYMVKPFKPSELVARIRTRLRRAGGEVNGSLTIGDLAIDIVEHTVMRGEREIPLTRLEFDLLVALAREPGRVFSRETLLIEVWGYRNSTDTRLVNVHIQRLRAKIEHDPENPTIILTVRGVGYKAGGSSARG
ncbi:MAG: DNA-binding response regulator [Actinobacteria bacterium]|jgi:two-component system, OmpR family, response regulator MtrA|nr:DNA-binding response regulator [Actinomycetota bacterium]NCW34611.1 DNA-binding response regulator [Actinomycetota bacterium]NCZ72967.1 DNA-binding response regulator [Actinomycetota bacterium]NDA41071.1 DNA-binding response regulator [Actinomycetota bacterium]NDB31045.1 DNA-binding response regulator [Actinomycetota bacterium]